MKPASAKNKVDNRVTKISEKIKDRIVIILDLSYSKINLDLILKYAKKVYIIDDHPISKSEIKNINKLKNKSFIGNDKHSASAYTWKFFFPTKKVPLYIQYVDNNDRKLNLPYLLYNDLIRTYNNYRIIHSPYLKTPDTSSDFEKLDKLLSKVDKNFQLVVGYYYNELANNIKEQVASNAVKKMFQGHPVYVLNYNDPVLNKMVARQMQSNAENKKDNIHFVVLWGFEYTANAYRIFLSEKHTGGTPKHNLPMIASKTWRYRGELKRGGGGSKIYW